LSAGGAAVAGFAGCTSSEDSSSSGEDATDASGSSGQSSTKITHWAGYFDDPDFPTDWYTEKAVERLGIEIQTSAFSYESLKQKFLTGGGTGTPDLLNGTFSQVGGYATSGRLEPITDRAEELDYFDEYPDSLISALTHKGELWGLPIQANGRILYYRKDIFEELGVDPPSDAESLLEIGEMVTQEIDGMFGFHNTTKKGEVRAFQEFMSHIYQVSDSLFELNNGEWSVTPSADDLGTVFDYFYARPYLGDGPTAANPGDRGTDWSANDIGYIEGNYAMIEGGPWILGFASQASDPEDAQEVLNNTGAVSLPAPPDASNPQGTYIGINTNMMNADSNNKDAAWDAFSLFSSPELHRTAASDDPQFISPPVFDNIDSGITSDDRQALNTAIENGTALTYVNWGPVQQEIWNEAQRVIFGRKDPYQAGEDIHASFQEVATSFET